MLADVPGVRRQPRTADGQTPAGSVGTTPKMGYRGLVAHGRGSRPLACKQCGVKRSDEVPISFRSLCTDCAIANVEQNNRDVRAKSGPAFDAWRQQMLRVLGLDDRVG